MLRKYRVQRSTFSYIVAKPSDRYECAEYAQLAPLAELLWHCNAHTVLTTALPTAMLSKYRVQRSTFSYIVAKPSDRYECAEYAQLAPLAELLWRCIAHAVLTTAPPVAMLSKYRVQKSKFCYIVAPPCVRCECADHAQLAPLAEMLWHRNACAVLTTAPPAAMLIKYRVQRSTFSYIVASPCVRCECAEHAQLAPLAELLWHRNACAVLTTAPPAAMLIKYRVQRSTFSYIVTKLSDR